MERTTSNPTAASAFQGERTPGATQPSTSTPSGFEDGHSETESSSASIAIDERYRYTFEGVHYPGLRPRDVDVYLPRDYHERPNRRYPVLYLHDGQLAMGRGLRVDLAVEALTREGRIEPHIVVAIHRTRDRSQELKPRGGSARYRIPGLERYAAMLLEVIKPLVDRNFRTRPERESTSVLGYSLGGLANFYFAVVHPEVFGRVACMSPSLWWSDGAALRALRRFRGPMPDRMWIDAGTGEGRPWESIPYFIRDIRHARDLALHKGMVLGENLGYFEDPGAPHADWAGARRMKAALAFLLSTERSATDRPSKLDIFVHRPGLSHRMESSYSVNAEYSSGVRLTLDPAAVALATSDPRVVRVSRHGMLAAREPGLATLTARWGDLRSDRTVEVRRRRRR